MKKLSLVATILVLVSNICFTQISKDVFPMGTFKPFDLDGGYYPGSFISKKKKSVQTPIITRERLDKVVCVKKIFDFSTAQDIPNRTLDRKKTFQTSLDVGVKYQGIDPEVKGGLEKAKDIALKVNKGKRYFLASGAVALQDIIYALPLEELKKIQFELDKKRTVYLITEVIEYDDAELVFKWDKSIEAGLKVKIPQILNLGTSNQWTDDATLVAKFKSGHLVSYKAIKIGKAYKKLIKKRLVFRETHGDDKCMYIDRDGDGYGDANSECKGIPAFDLSKFPNYIEKGGDCYDENANVHPGQTKFFTLNRGDGSFDYDCDGSVTLQYNNNGRCQGCEAAVQGWDGPIPKAGQTGQYLVGCNCNYFCRDCDMQRVARAQGGL